MQDIPERRRHERRACIQPCKVYHRATGLYLPAWTRNISGGGVGLVLDAARPLAAGEAVSVLFAPAGAGVLSAESGHKGRVVRAGRDGSAAVRFERAA